MKKINLSEFDLQTKILWCAMLALSIFAVGFSIQDILSYSISQLVVLTVTLFISFLVNQHSIKIGGGRTNFSAKEFIIFWGIIWLGAGGGILLAAGAMLAKFNERRKDFERYLFHSFCSIGAALAAGEVFYLFLQKQSGFSSSVLAETSVGTIQFLSAVLLMAIAHYCVNFVVYTAFLIAESKDSLADVWKKNFSGSAFNYLLMTAATVVFHYTFVYFGIAFGVVLLPVSIIAHLAYRIHRRSLAQKTREISEASRIHLATVEALATAIDARDQVGIGHVRRTQIYAIGIGKILGLSENEIDALRTGALLHDIGKLAVPDHILNKPGRLTPAEMEKTKIHASVGASILEKVGFTCPVVPTVKYHHEMWDGSGYPEGLQGAEIPLTARILSVADAYDTLRGARPYRPAVSRDEARRFLLSNAGTQFDPKIVDVFLRNLRRFEMEVHENGLSYNFEGEEKIENLHHTDNGGEQNYVEQIKRANREVFTLYELARIFSTSLNLQDTLSLFARKISDFVPFDSCAIFLLDESGEYASAVYAEGKNRIALKSKRVKVGEGATGYVLKSRLPVQNINPRLDFSHSNYEVAQDYTAMASLPLITNDKLIGAVSLYSCELLGYQEEHLRLLETVARIAADAISKSIEHAETETKALTDPMTGLPNARSLQLQFEKEVARASRSGSSFQVLMLDLDGFKAVNDTYGHKVGDQMLKGIADAMSQQLREYDFLARYAGDEFVAIIPETNEKAVSDLCGRIEKAVAGFRLKVGEGVFTSVGVSLGTASYPRCGESFDQMIIAADKAMYAVKAARKRRQQEAERNKETHSLPQASGKRDFDQAQVNPDENLVHEITEQDFVREMTDENFIVELDESHIISSAVN
jgi:diguanylate cyclase (GGDEF)-like protein/putative nucleotidyltransferase with HDIG domain